MRSAPVEAIRREVASIGGSDLHRRVPAGEGNDEIARLARTMNDMLERVEDASVRQQRFVADASHELRSPLARMRSELEVDLAHSEGADLTATHHRVLAETAGLQRLVDDLLHLARSDAGRVDIRREPVDLDDVVLSQARRLRLSNRIVVDLGQVSAAQVLGDRELLTRAVQNLADNAARHARTRVSFALNEVGGRAVLAISDDGPGIPIDEHERVFERFSRLDQARTYKDGGAGLGLAIARDIIVRHEGTIRIDRDHNPGARLVVDLPAAS